MESFTWWVCQCRWYEQTVGIIRYDPAKAGGYLDAETADVSG